MKTSIKHLILFLICLTGLTSQTMGQSSTFHGALTWDGVNVRVFGTAGSITNLTNFSIRYPAGTAWSVRDFPGTASFSVSTTGSRSITDTNGRVRLSVGPGVSNPTMFRDDTGLDSVWVTGGGDLIATNNLKVNGSTTLSGVTVNSLLYDDGSHIIQPVTIGSGVNFSAGTLTGTGGGGTVTTFSSGNLSPLFTASVANATTTPALTFAQVSQSANTFLAGPTNGSSANPTFRNLVAADLPSSVSAGLKIGLPFGTVGPYVSAAGVTYVANGTATCLFTVDSPSITISNVYWSLTANTLGQFAGFAIYNVTIGSATRGSRIADTGPVDVNTTPTGPVKTPIGPVTLTTGTYCVSFTASSATVTILGTVPSGGTTTAINMYNACPEVYYGSGANPGVNGQNPTTLGVITGSGVLHFPTIVLGN